MTCPVMAHARTDIHANPRPRLRALAPALAAALACAAHAPATPPPVAPSAPPQPAPADPAAPPSAPPAPDLASLHPGQRLGVRAELVRRQRAVAPTVVLVPDAVSYIGAVGAWRPKAIFPVLIDDGTPRAAEDIGRFVRAFRPERVVRWSAPPPPRPVAGEDLRARVEEAVGVSWGLAEPPFGRPQVAARWRSLGLTPPGLVVMNDQDPAWTAGLALAAGRAMPIVWASAPVSPGGTMSRDEALALQSTIEDGARDTGLAWEALGDDLDAIALCLGAPGRVRLNDKDVAALTDLIGRKNRGDGSLRWAWSSQVFGSESTAAYRAMSALFLPATRAWLFDGYETGEPWDGYDLTRAADILRQAGLETDVIDSPRNGRREWEARLARPVDAALIFLNSKGNADFFDLSPGRMRPGDTPILTVPAAAYVVHSWSAQAPDQRTTVAGRWLERGAFAYVGSVQEPFLQGFVPSPALAARTAANFAWAAACRFDDGPLWRIHAIGDPLWSAGPEAPRLTSAGAPDGAALLDEDMRAALREREFPRALRALVMLGRDADASALARALIAESDAPVNAGQPPAAPVLSPQAAAAAILPLFRDGRNAAVVRAARALTDAPGRLGRWPAIEDPVLLDALWLASRPLQGAGDQSTLDVLRRNLRPDQVKDDAAELAAAWERAQGAASARAMLESLRDALPADAGRGSIDEVLRERAGAGR